MIYSLSKEGFPEKEQCHEYNDQDGVLWKLAVVDNGFILGYFGDDYFAPKYFFINFNLWGRMINNSKCFFFNSKELDLFINIRTIIQDGSTNQIWQVIQSLIQTRLEEDAGYLTPVEINYE